MTKQEIEYRRIAYLFYFPSCNGKCKPGWVLHHRDMTLKYEDPVRYHEWRITDLIPMTTEEHTHLHHKGLKHVLGKRFKRSPEVIEKNRRAQLGKKMSEEAKRLIGIASTGRKHTDAVKKQISEKQVGRIWWTNGQENKHQKECPGEGWIRGMTRKCSLKNYQTT